jgi:hypothetical protein
LCDEARDQEVDVVDVAAGIDRSAEHVAEDDGEQDGIDRRHGEQLRCSRELQEGSPRRLSSGREKACSSLLRAASECWSPINSLCLTGHWTSAG